MLNNGVITAPVTVSDVKQCLSESTYNLGKLCTSSNINKWAKYRPLYYEKTSGITYNEREYVKFGWNIYSETTGVILSDNTFRHFEWSYNYPTSYYRLGDFINYSHKAVCPLLFEFPNKLTIGVNDSLTSGINASFDNGVNNWYSDSCIGLKDIIPDSNLDYYFTVGLLIYKSSSNKYSTWYITDTKTLRQRYSEADLMYTDVNLSLSSANVSSGDTVEMIYFLSNNYLPNGQSYLTDNSVTSLEYEYGVDRRTYTVEYVSPTKGLTGTISFELNSTTGTQFWVTSVTATLTKDDTYVPSVFYLNIQAELASVKWIYLVQNINPTFTGNTYTNTWSYGQLPEENFFEMNTEERDLFTCEIHFNDPSNSYTEVLAYESIDVNN